MTEKYWAGTVPKNDDFGCPITGGEFVDGRTRYGPWAIMSLMSHRENGVGLGTGKGQRYRQQSDGRWLKIEG